MANKNLSAAKAAKNNEFYTRLVDVEAELYKYTKHFKDKIMLCNCDDPTWSAFWQYFHLKFSVLGLKKLISTHYDPEHPTYKMEYTGGNDNDTEAGVKTPLVGNGDFRSQECLDLLDEADIVVTNPPFSLFREYVAVLMEHQKKFDGCVGFAGALCYLDYRELSMQDYEWFFEKLREAGICIIFDIGIASPPDLKFFGLFDRIFLALHFDFLQRRGQAHFTFAGSRNEGQDLGHVPNVPQRVPAHHDKFGV